MLPTANAAAPFVHDPSSWMTGAVMAFDAQALTPPSSRQSLTATPSTIGVLRLYGPLWPRQTLVSRFAGGTCLTDLRTWLEALVLNPTIRSIVLDIDSPGGSVYGVTETWRAIRQADAITPVTAVITGCGASAAYWLASAARRIVATPSAEVGSVGVYGVHQDRSRYYAAKGITHTPVAAGAHKVDGLDIVPLTNDAKAAMQRRVDLAYGRFITDVAAGRRTSPERVRAGYGEGRLLSAEDALRAGLVDGIATFDDTLDALHRRGELTALSGGLPMTSAAAADQWRRAELARLTRMWKD